MQVDLDGAQILMAEKERYCCQVDSGLQEVHGGGMSERMHAYLFVGE